MPQLEIANTVAQKWLSHHYEVIKILHKDNRSLFVVRHLGNTPGTAKFKGEVSFVLVETENSLNGDFTVRHRNLAKKIGSFAIVMPRAFQHMVSGQKYIAVLHSY